MRTPFAPPRLDGFMARSRSISKDKATPPYFAGIDLGGTNIKVGIVDDSGQVLVRSSTPTQTNRGPEEGARRMGEAVRKAMEKAGLVDGDVVYAGLATPGTMDIPKGIMRACRRRTPMTPTRRLTGSFGLGAGGRCTAWCC
jgi:hypothetical protein